MRGRRLVDRKLRLRKGEIHSETRPISEDEVPDDILAAMIILEYVEQVFVSAPQQRKRAHLIRIK